MSAVAPILERGNVMMSLCVNYYDPTLMSGLGRPRGVSGSGWEKTQVLLTKPLPGFCESAVFNNNMIFIQ